MTDPARPRSTSEQAPDRLEHASPTWSMRRGILHLRVTWDGCHSTLELDGEIDRSSAALLEQAIRRAEASVAETVTIDLRHVHFLDLSGLRAILDADAWLGGRLRLRKAPDDVQCVFRITGAEAILPFEP